MTTEAPRSEPSMRRAAGLIAATIIGLVTGVGLVAVVVIGGLDAGQLAVARGSEPDRSSTATRDAAALSDGYRVWARNDDGRAVRWDPCRSIDLVVDDTGAPDGFHADLRAAVARLEAASGLELRMIGATDERPGSGRASYQPARYGERWAPVLVAWAEPHAQGLPLEPFDRGLAMPVAVGAPGDQTYVTGQVVFNRTRTDLRAGDDDRATSWGATILHELVHLVGLGHVDDPDELMYTYPGAGPVQLGRGDTAGLRSLGTSAGCHPPPPPRPVEVVERP